MSNDSHDDLSVSTMGSSSSSSSAVQRDRSPPARRKCACRGLLRQQCVAAARRSPSTPPPRLHILRILPATEWIATPPHGSSTRCVGCGTDSALTGRLASVAAGTVQSCAAAAINGAHDCTHDRAHRAPSRRHPLRLWPAKPGALRKTENFSAAGTTNAKNNNCNSRVKLQCTL